VFFAKFYIMKAYGKAVSLYKDNAIGLVDEKSQLPQKTGFEDSAF
jgi:hypothetical protein